MDSPASRIRFVVTPRPWMQGGFPYPADYALSRGRPEPRPAILLRHPIGCSGPVVVQECPPVVHRLRPSASP